MDNHLTRLAVRLGLVVFEDYGVVDRGVELSRSEDVELRLRVREAWKMVSEASGVDPFTLDDFLWSYGRTVCLQGRPRCGSCFLRDVCRSFEMGYFPDEPRYSLTWYY